MKRQLGMGVVEGFYGMPWSHASRLSMLRFLEGEGLRTFLRAPKNDPERVDRPSHPLSSSARRELRELCAEGRDRGVEVAVAITPEHLLSSDRLSASRLPGRQTTMSTDAADRFDDRVRDLVSVGVRTLVVAFDDTWTTFLPFLARTEKGAFHGKIAMRAKELATELDRDAEVFVVPAIYHGRAGSLTRGALSYLLGLASVARSIPAAWTGPAVFARAITRSELLAMAEVTGLELWIWNNRIANDWLPLATGEALGLRASQKLSFGPVDNLSPGLAPACAGILLNGAREPELTKISLRTLAAYARDPANYDARTEHELAITRATKRESRDSIHAVYELTKKHPLSAPSSFEASELDALIRRYSASSSHHEELERALDRLIAVHQVALASSSPVEIEVLPALKKASLIARATKAVIGANAGREKLSPTALREARESLTRAQSIRWEIGLDEVARWTQAKLSSG